MKYILLLISSLLIVGISAGLITERITDNSSYEMLTAYYDDDYSYMMSEGLPVIPQLRIMHSIRGIVKIDSVTYTINRTDTINNCIIISGENPLPLSFNPGKRSELQQTKGIFPPDIVKISAGQKGNEGIIFGNAAVYQTDGSTIYHHRDIEICIYYSVKEKPKIKALPAVLIMTEDSLKSSWSSYENIYPNFNVLVRSVNELMTLYPLADTTIALREYARSLYADSNLQAMIIGLDTDRIPGVYVTLQITPQIDVSSATVVTDKYYSCLDGNWDGDNDGIVGEMEDSIDIFPDIAISRCPLVNSNDISNFINKIIKFKQGTGDTILLVASYLDNNTDGSIAMDNLAVNTPFDDPLKTLYERDANLSSASFTGAIDNSPFAVFHDGHGSYTAIQSGMDYTYSSDMDGLSNSRPVLMYTLSCLSAGYDTDCLAEHFFNSPGGGFYIGNSRYGWYTPYFPGFGTADILMARFSSYFMNNEHNPARVLNSVFADYANEISGFNDYRWAFMALTYFGDPLINIYREFDTYSINMQHAVRNDYFAFTVPVRDSLIVSIEGDSIHTQTLYENSNLFSCPVYNEDSLLIRLASGNSVDTLITVFTLPDDSIAYLADYGLSMTASDSALLFIDLHVSHAGSYTIKPGDITDTMTCLTSDSVFNLSSDTTLYFDYHVSNVPSSRAVVPLHVNGDLLLLQTGINMSDNIELGFITNKAFYRIGETILADMSVNNSSNETYHVDIELSSDSLNYCDTVYSGNLDAFTEIQLTDTLTGDSMLSSDMHLMIYGSYQNKSCLYDVAMALNESYYNCETYDDLSIDSSTAYFHTSNKRAYSGTYSLFSGFRFSSTYPRNYITAVTSPVFQYNRHAIFGFSTFYDVEGGFDYCIVSLHTDSSDIPVITLSGQSDGWEHFAYNAEDFPIADNSNTCLKFSFFSEDDSYQYEGWYIDDIVLPGIRQNTGLQEEGFSIDMEQKKNSICFDMSSSMLTVDYQGRASLSICDVSGRIIDSKELKRGIHSIYLNMPQGIYFVRIRSGGSESVKKITVLR